MGLTSAVDLNRLLTLIGVTKTGFHCIIWNIKHIWYLENDLKILVSNLIMIIKSIYIALLNFNISPDQESFFENSISGVTTILTSIFWEGITKVPKKQWTNAHWCLKNAKYLISDFVTLLKPSRIHFN